MVLFIELLLIISIKSFEKAMNSCSLRLNLVDSHSKNNKILN